MPSRAILPCVATFLVIGWIAQATTQAAPTLDQRKQARALADGITEAGRLFQQKKFRECADAVRSIQAEVEKLAADGDADMIELLKPQYERLKTAHALLELQGVTLPALVEPSAKPKEPAKPVGTPAPANGKVSFVTQVAPVVINRCGRCHISKTSGGFNMASYEILMKGPQAGVVVFPGDGVGSRIIEVIVEGDMPRGGKMGPGELELLQKWIVEGAKFDGPDPKAELTSLSPDAVPAEMPMVMVAQATGKETVSFARDIAPVLVANCTGCHLNAQQIRGNLNFTTFDGLLKGGDSGAPVLPGKPDESLLVQKLLGKGGGQRMPVGRPPLNDAIMAKITKWIEEGAKYDGGSPADRIETVAALAKANASTHEELSADRAVTSEENWRMGMAGIKPSVVQTKNFLLLGNVGENTLNEIGELAESVVPKIATMFKAPVDPPMIKGRLTLFVFQQRYDYSEFGNMVEKRKLPPEWRGHWGFNVVDAYGAFVAPRADEYSAEAMIGQQLAGAYIASLGKLPPHWFAEGAARVAASRLAADDPRVIEWDAALPVVVSQMAKPDDFLTGKLPPESADVASYSYVNYLMSDSKRFGQLLSALRQGEDFERAFAVIYGGPPSQFTAPWANKAAKAGPKRRVIGSR